MLWTQSGQLGLKVLYLGLAGLTGAVVYLLMAAILRVEELKVFFRRLRRRS